MAGHCAPRHNQACRPPDAAQVAERPGPCMMSGNATAIIVELSGTNIVPSAMLVSTARCARSVVLASSLFWVASILFSCHMSTCIKCRASGGNASNDGGGGGAWPYEAGLGCAFTQASSPLRPIAERGARLFQPQKHDD